MARFSDGASVPIFLAPASSYFGMVRTPALASQQTRSLTPSFHAIQKADRATSPFVLIGCPVWNHISRRQLRIFRPDLQKWNRTSAPSLHVCARSTHWQFQDQMYPVRHDPGFQVNGLMVLQQQGPMAQDHLMTTETQDEDLIHSPVPKMNHP